MSLQARLANNWDLMIAEQSAVYASPGWQTFATEFEFGSHNALLGIDPEGFRHLLIPTIEAEIFEDDRSAGVHMKRIELEVESFGAKTFVDIVCLKHHLDDLFSVLATDLLDQIDSNEKNISARCIILLEEWRELFAREINVVMGLDALTGLFGELMCLQLIVQKNAAAIQCWTGPDKSIHDFVSPGVALEVKTSRIRNGRYAEIHGIDQLADPPSSSLYLAYIKTEIVRGDGQTVPELIENIKSTGVDREVLYAKLLKSGYNAEHTSHYENISFRTLDIRFYTIDSDFPKIIRDSLINGDVHPLVTDVRYRIDLTGEPPHSLTDEQVADVISSLAQI